MMQQRGEDKQSAGLEHVRRVTLDVGSVKRRARALEARASAGLPAAVLSSLPSNPINGQTIDFADATMAAAGVRWRLVYNADSASAYKWEFIGGAWYVDTSPSGQTFTTASYVDITGLSVAVPLAGDYQIQGTVSFRQTTAANTIQANALIGAVSATQTQYIDRGVTAGTDARGALTFAVETLAGVAALDSARLQVKLGSAAGTATINIATVGIIPVRVG